MSNCVYQAITLKPRLASPPDALIFDNSNGLFELSHFEAKNISITAVQPATGEVAGDGSDADFPSIISNLLHVVAHNISLVEVSANDIKLEQRQDNGSPIQLRIANSTQ